MPCYIRIRPTISLLGPYENVDHLLKALGFLGLKVIDNEIYKGTRFIGKVKGNTIETETPEVFSRLPQQMAVIKATETARRKGWRVSQKTDEKTGDLVLVINNAFNK